MQLDFAAPRRRRISLTPMIDVVFLLLVFFMLAARFGTEGLLPVLAAGGGGGAWSGPPRLVDVRPEGVSLNGTAVAPGELAAALARLSDSPDDPVVMRGRDGATLQRLADVARAAAPDGRRPVIFAP
ncbi:biopolymer transporter ExbD [Albimonas sp. CAU 1670]|uniref:ExbD/TolR family protein n=1 Tax=Albimonas sp. CAU 1670 TaxID=3032599 RepID=UPI0023DBBF08|nr:biopolymer transporter ExbD [Albimonas sp. CAU 1670]MDF2232068.1 biopolymer transporter ExbD [Albimonas sp. CAU 1670]